MREGSPGKGTSLPIRQRTSARGCLTPSSAGDTSVSGSTPSRKLTNALGVGRGSVGKAVAMPTRKFTQGRGRTGAQSVGKASARKPS